MIIDVTEVTHGRILWSTRMKTGLSVKMGSTMLYSVVQMKTQVRQTRKLLLSTEVFLFKSVFFFNIINIKTIYPVPPPRFTTKKAILMNEKPMLCPKLHTWHTSSQQIVLWGTNFYAIASSQNTHCLFCFSHRKRRRCWSCDFFYKHVVGTMWTLYDTQTKSTAQHHCLDSSL